MKIMEAIISMPRFPSITQQLEGRWRVARLRDARPPSSTPWVYNVQHNPYVDARVFTYPA